MGWGSAGESGEGTCREQTNATETRRGTTSASSDCARSTRFVTARALSSYNAESLSNEQLCISIRLKVSGTGLEVLRGMRDVEKPTAVCVVVFTAQGMNKLWPVACCQVYSSMFRAASLVGSFGRQMHMHNAKSVICTARMQHEVGTCIFSGFYRDAIPGAKAR